MKELTLQENQQTTGGSWLTGSLLSGIASIITSVTELITGIGGMVYAFEHAGEHDSANIDFNKNTSVDYDDSESVKNDGNINVVPLAEPHSISLDSSDTHDTIDSHHDLYAFH